MIITDNIIKTIVKHSTSLEDLRITCNIESNNSLVYLLNSYKNLKILHLIGCKLSEINIDNINNYDNLECLYIRRYIIKSEIAHRNLIDKFIKFKCSKK